MTFDIERGPSWALARLSGEIDMTWVETQQESITKFFEDCPSLVVVDLEPVTFMDSTGLGWLTRCITACQANNGKVIVVGPNDSVRRTIEIAGLDQHLTIVDTSAEQFTHDLPTSKDLDDMVV